ncbi:YigZ family protein [Parvimonas sp. C2]|jgi:YigZ family protein|uniref:YigZ family protein n=1 Tax=Parvimonas sp. C2 TaxID=3110692 RepID=UPI002B46EC25|nr:YigZ family protein [Parvimonas sp. C2]MEB3072289.1 YigZ family protein [Parvimonas sp. C2]
MENNEIFLSIHSNQSYSFIINKSEFIGHAFYVESVAEAEKYISEIREKYKDATHNCFAYIIGIEKLIQKYSDDGEPSGTAGIPMLEVLRKKDITNCLVISTRYFGGILLGAGGLVRAYTKSTVGVLEESKIVKKELFYNMDIILDYVFWGKIENIFKNFGLEILNIEYLEKVRINLSVKKENFEMLKNIVINETSDNCIVKINGENYCSVFIE